MKSTGDSQTGSALLGLLSDPTNPERWGPFVDRYGPKIYGWCRRWHLQEADAEDVTQSVLAKLAEKMKAFTYDAHSGTFRGWLKTLTDHALTDFLRSRSRTPIGSGDSRVRDWLESVEARGDLFSKLEAEFDLELLEQAESRVQLRVSENTWEAYRLVVKEGRSEAEAAIVCNLRIAALYMAKSRVQKMMKEEISKLEGAV